MTGWWLLVVSLLAIIFIVYATSKFGMPGDKILSAITGGFGKILRYIGIATGIITESHSEKSDVTLSMAEKVLRSRLKSKLLYQLEY